MMTRMRRLAQAAVGSLLLLSALPSGSSAAARDRDNARVFVPEEQAGDELHLLLQQFETLGIHRFEPLESQPAKPWEPLRTASSEFDLVWTTNGLPPYAELRFPSDFQAKVNHFPGSELLTVHDQLESLMRTSRKKYGNFHFSYVPRRFMLGQKDVDNAQVDALIAELSRQHTHFRYLLRVPPAKLDAPHSSGIKIRDVAKLKEAMGSQFKGVAAVEAIEYNGPYLLEGNQFRAGFYVLVTSLDPIRIYIHSNAEIRVTKAGYPASESINWERPTESMPLWDFAPFQPEFTELPSAEREGSNAWRIVKRYMMIRGIDTNLLQREINAAVIKTVLAGRSHLKEQISKLKREKKNGDAPPNDLGQSFFELWKFDFEIDHTGKPWLHKVQANPSLAPESSIMATDEGLKKRLAFDVLNIIGVHPQAKQPFEKFFRPSDASFCQHKCQDKTRAWDSACWSCPGWFPPYVARTLFDAMQEYSRRGRFNLAFPDLDRDFSRFTSTPLSEHDHAWDRYIKSLSSAYAEHQDFPINDRVVTCVYREHCSDHGDCVNGRCRCDEGYEGSTCYVPQDPTRKKAVAAATVGSAATGETWKERMGHLWNAHPATEKPPSPDQIVASRFSASKLLLGLLVLSGFLYVAHLLVLRYGASFGTASQDEADDHKHHHGVAGRGGRRVRAAAGERVAAGHRVRVLPLRLPAAAAHPLVRQAQRHHAAGGGAAGRGGRPGLLQLHAMARAISGLLIMLIPERLPVFNVLLQAQLYYMAFVATSRLRIDMLIQPMAMGCLVVLLAFPFELAGAKFLWWTWHDTDPLLQDRFYGVPVHVLFYHYYFASGLLCAHNLLRSALLKGAYYEEEHWKREWSYVVLLPVLSTCLAIVCLILFYHGFVHVLGVHAPAAFFLVMSLSLLMCWVADRTKDAPFVQNQLDPVDAYDSDWLYPSFDHAVNQMVFLYSLVLSLLLVCTEPSDIVSLGHHQPLGSCYETETFRSLVGMEFERKKFLCVHEFDEEFGFCNYPLTQLHYEDSWYMICGRGYGGAYPTYAAFAGAIFFVLNLLFFVMLKRPSATSSLNLKQD